MRSGNLRIEQVPVTRDAEGTPAPAYTAWVNTVGEGFYGKPLTGDRLEQMFQAYQVDQRVITAVYDDTRDDQLADPLVPVATYSSFSKSLNIGAASLPVHMITSVTVRPTHRRRGILRKLIVDDLSAAKTAGCAVAALTATEGTIYGRFGFGRSTEAQRMDLDVRGDVRFNAEPVGSMIQLAPGKLAEHASGIFERFHANQRGSIGRQESYLRLATGAWGPEGQEPDPKLRAALYLDEAGVPQGYVTYAFAGWDTKPFTLEIRDLVAATPVARREIFRFMCAHDLIERVSYPYAAADEPLGWAIEDPARLSFLEREHHLWVRVLDVPAAFAARSYSGEGAFTLQVTDALGLAAGSYDFAVFGGRATITRAADDARATVACHVQVIGSLLMGSATLTQLHAAGVLQIDDPAEVLRLGAILDLPGLPHAINGF